MEHPKTNLDLVNECDKYEETNVCEKRLTYDKLPIS